MELAYSIAADGGPFGGAVIRLRRAPRHGHRVYLMPFVGGSLAGRDCTRLLTTESSDAIAFVFCGDRFVLEARHTTCSRLPRRGSGHPT
jgi:hypothetical protein